MQNFSQKGFAVIILAAGQGKRMKNPAMAKVMYEVGDKPMIGHVVELAQSCKAYPIVVVVGHQREIVIEYLKTLKMNMQTVVQEPQLGTGHAVMQTEKALENFDGDVLVLSGDVPLLRKETIENLYAHHRESKAVATVLTVYLDDPVGYGRIIRNPNGSVEKIVEHKDATEEELRVNEINTGIYIFDRKKLFSALNKIRPDNVQNEFYLTDVIHIMRQEDKTVSAIVAENPNEVSGVNTMKHLQQMNKIYASL